MPFTKKTHKANSDGSIGMIVPHHVTGPDGEEIEPGDTLTVKIVDIDKQGGEE